MGAPTIASRRSRPATGFLVLLLSPVPMVRGFGLLLVVGIAVALACALSAGSAAIALGDRDRRRARRVAARRGRDPARRRQPASPAPAVRSPAQPRSSATRARGRAAAFQRVTAGLLAAVIRRPGRVLALGAVLALLGWVADTQTAVQSDVTKLVPSSMPALRDLRTLERVTGVSGEIDVIVHARNVATPAHRRLDDPLREHAAHALRLPRDEGLRALDAVPGAVAAGSVPGRHAARSEPDSSSAVVDRQPAGSGSQLLLAGGASPPTIATRHWRSGSG